MDCPSSFRPVQGGALYKAGMFEDEKTRSEDLSKCEVTLVKLRKLQNRLRMQFFSEFLLLERVK